ncbi:MAG TPA: YggS family pyridoxal phosphate-dependent enzyme [Staphylococcus auricularis]|uniref:Pyridoxal phosphate homeostasis protein n=1 Tax=Staphylococcus auricularis TaxID=29379 RepID=A0AAP8PQG1_9STAP|nr:YggS family pyridoxal phosphate-dependent enzyme [Staphylococcus auricularis]MBM0867647.1 YggS family pyridoxal phosphate-dependent enzyme [Staphylococcus auricularis]MCG7340513.1 YggS family pyridoxal phosphate-dependent enzyme [Staphylococcus auricularis]MDC6326465.1 YggS family pyridoxal phosphate-dependent enzyme [Staphylococcus auricularis]MDN4532342.1 YggS family pyridoxal phosphate-dependent enzyme [Staphylococcus auricularis]PNZ69062.1 YggS family pyridoxal phosphate-dependent enzym
MNVKENLTTIQQQIQAATEKGQQQTEPNVIAVTKYVTMERAKEAYDAGLRHFGENRVEGFIEKQDKLPDDVTMHFIGSLQSRKVKDVINQVDYFHGLDRMKIAKEIDKRADHTIRCFVQVNVSGESSKHGIGLSEVNDFIQDLAQYEHIEVVGLMTMAPLTDDEDYIHQLFKSLKNKRDEIKALNLTHAPCTELSMGMSNDFHIAAEEGASFVRIGTKLVGKEE